MANYIVTVGPRAYSFHDQSTGITIARGQEKELNSRQWSSRKIQRALASGHLVLIPNKANLEAISEKDVEKMYKRIQAQFKQGMEISKVSKGYNMEQAKALAKKFSLEPDPNDTVETLIQAIFEELEK